jgi:hypothetical protein
LRLGLRRVRLGQRDDGCVVLCERPRAFASALLLGACASAAAKPVSCPRWDRSHIEDTPR